MFPGIHIYTPARVRLACTATSAYIPTCRQLSKTRWINTVLKYSQVNCDMGDSSDSDSDLEDLQAMFKKAPYPKRRSRVIVTSDSSMSRESDSIESVASIQAILTPSPKADVVVDNYDLMLPTSSLDNKFWAQFDQLEAHFRAYVRLDRDKAVEAYVVYNVAVNGLLRPSKDQPLQVDDTWLNSERNVWTKASYNNAMQRAQRAGGARLSDSVNNDWLRFDKSKYANKKQRQRRFITLIDDLQSMLAARNPSPLNPDVTRRSSLSSAATPEAKGAGEGSASGTAIFKAKRISPSAATPIKIDTSSSGGLSTTRKPSSSSSGELSATRRDSMSSSKGLGATRRASISSSEELGAARRPSSSTATRRDTSRRPSAVTPVIEDTSDLPGSEDEKKDAPESEEGGLDTTTRIRRRGRTLLEQARTPAFFTTPSNIPTRSIAKTGITRARVDSYLSVLLDVTPTRAPTHPFELNRSTTSTSTVGTWDQYSDTAMRAYMSVTCELCNARLPTDDSEYGRRRHI